MPSNFVKVQVGTRYLLEVSPNAFPSGAGFFSLTSSQYFPPRIPLGWWVYSGSLADTSSELFFEGVVVPGQGDVTETTGSLIHTGSTEFTGSVNVSIDLSVIGSASVAELDWDGSVQDLSLFSSSVSSEFTDIETDSGSFDDRIDVLEAAGAESGSLWTGSDDGTISRESDVKITGSLNVTETGSFGFLEVNGDTIITKTLEVTETGSFGRVEATSSRFGEAVTDLHEFTGSVDITGSLNVNGTASVSEVEWDGSIQNLSLFSSSVSSEFTDIETDSGSFDTRIDSLESFGFFFQAIHTGSTDVNSISPVSLSWDTQDLLDSPFTHSTSVVSSSEIQVGVSGWYGTSYSVLHESLGNSRTSIQSIIRLNGFTNIQKTQVVAYKRNRLTGAATTNVWSGLIQLSSSDFIELILSNAGGGTIHEVNTIPSSSLITLQLVRQV